MKKRRIIVNNDYYNIFQIEPPVTDTDICNAVDKIANSQVDTLFMLMPVNMQVGGKRENLDSDLVALYSHPETDPCVNTMNEIMSSGKDPIAMLLERARKKGMEFFGSIRMNDTHYLDQIFNPWVGYFYYDNLHNRVGKPVVRKNTEFDYRKTVIRERMLAIIKEVVDKYDVDGIEMDMTRNCKYFPEGDDTTGFASECAPVMTEFVRDVRNLLDSAEKKRGHKIYLCATIPCSLYEARLEGLDIPTWAKLGLIDMFCMSSQFTADFDRDVYDAKMKVPGVQVYAGCDRNFDWPGRVVPMETYRAMAMTYLRQGADGIYLYNVMDWTMDMDRLPAMLLRHGGQSPSCYDIGLIHEVGEISTLEYLDKLYLMSHGKEVVDKPYASLPVTVPGGGEITLRITVGDDVAKAQKENRLKAIYLQTISSDCSDYNNYTVMLNSIDLSRQYAFLPFAEKPQEVLLFPEPNNKKPLPEPEKARRHPVRHIDLLLGTNFITIKSYKEPLTITDVEIAVMYK